ncbi:MAG: nitrate ABC transporter substrate-binding protein, partial [Candidatus Saccharimonadales bacterium]
YHEFNITFVAMRADLIKQRPDVVKAWLNAEVDAQLFISDPKNQKEIVAMFIKANQGAYTPQVFWNTLYGTYPGEENASKVRLNFVFTFTSEVMAIVDKDVKFLRSIHVINVDKLRNDAIVPQFAEEVLKERGLKSPVGVVYALSKSPYKP